MIKTLCYFSFICGTDRSQNLMRKINKRFHEQLDVRSFVRVRTNLALLLRLLFTDQQLILYRHQRRRSMSHPIKGESSSSSMDESSDDLGK